MKKDHLYYMKLAMKLALKAKGMTSPNPLVGAVVVRQGKIVGKGYHKKAGLAHAETLALGQAGARARGARLYVTLEPCAHVGRTPACTDAVIASGVKEVYIGMIDPNPLNNGKGASLLARHGLAIHTGFLEAPLKRINESFIKYITRKMPFITIKVGQSLDGKIATYTGDSKWITSDKARAYAHRLRQEYDAIMVGVNTVLRDDPNLDAWYTDKKLVKIVVDSQLSTPAHAKIFAHNSRVIIVTLPAKSGQETPNRAMLSRLATIVEVKEKNGQINLADMLKQLARRQITSILVEGGGTLIGSLVDEKLVDKALFFISPKIIGGKSAISSVMGKGVTRVEQALKIKEVTCKRIGEDFLLQGYSA